MKTIKLLNSKEVRKRYAVSALSNAPKTDEGEGEEDEDYQAERDTCDAETCDNSDYEKYKENAHEWRICDYYHTPDGSIIGIGERVKSRKKGKKRKKNGKWCARCAEIKPTVDVYQNTDGKRGNELQKLWDGETLCLNCTADVIGFGGSSDELNLRDIRKMKKNKVSNVANKIAKFSKRIEENAERTKRILEIAEQLAEKAALTKDKTATTLQEILKKNPVDGNSTRLAIVAEKKRRQIDEENIKRMFVGEGELSIKVNLEDRYRARLIYEIIRLITEDDVGYTEEEFIQFLFREGLNITNGLMRRALDIRQQLNDARREDIADEIGKEMEELTDTYQKLIDHKNELKGQKKGVDDGLVLINKDGRKVRMSTTKKDRTICITRMRKRH